MNLQEIENKCGEAVYNARPHIREIIEDTFGLIAEVKRLEETRSKAVTLITALRRENKELVRKANDLTKERDAAVTDMKERCSICKHLLGITSSVKK